MMNGVWFGIVLALIFGFALTNGFLDGGGIVSTVIMTRVLNPLTALLIVSVCEAAGVLVLGRAVARTLGIELLHFPAGAAPSSILMMLMAAMSGAFLWNMTMWRLALPGSSSHALLGGLLGAATVHFGPHAVSWPVVLKILAGLGLVPITASVLSFVLARAVYWIGQSLTPAVGGLLRKAHVAVLAGMAIVHGSNDGQKSVALVFMAVLAMGGMGFNSSPDAFRPSHLPLWISLACGITLGLGVVIGSRKTVRTVGQGIYKMQSLQGLCAETSAMLLVGASSLAGYPMATSHVMSSAVLGTGVAARPGGVRWRLAGGIGLAWLITIPAAATLSGMISYVVSKAF